MLSIGTPFSKEGLGQSVAAAQPRLAKAAHEFEAQMMNELLKPLTESDGLTGDEDDTSLGSAGAIGSFASEALGRALSEHGGLGIANGIIRTLSRSRNDNRDPEVSGNYTTSR
jgi:Rod binding domain-containing protein